MTNAPRAVVANAAGEITDVAGLRAAARAGEDVFPLDPAELVPLPDASRLLFLPGRTPLAYEKAARPRPSRSTARSRSRRSCRRAGPASRSPPSGARRTRRCSRSTPTPPCAGTAAASASPARRVDDDSKHDPESFALAEIEARVAELRARLPNNRLVAHHGARCALEWGCPNAQNLFLGRFEAPIAVARACNAACIACISEQPRRHGAVAAAAARVRAERSTRSSSSRCRTSSARRAR